MSVQQPAWLKRTRPCPFFSQGRCLFADSCNFLHDVKVRSALHQPLPSTSQAKHPSFPPNPVFDPPSVVINSASPRPVNQASPGSLASPVQDSSRYSGLLSVLSDVIGPHPGLPATTDDVPEAASAILPTVQSPTDLLSGSDLAASSFESASIVAYTETQQASSSCAGPSSIFQFDSEATLVDPLGHPAGSFFPEEDGEPGPEFLPVPDDTESAPGNNFVEGANTCQTGSEDGDDHGEEGLTVMGSNRQSALSSFTGASLLASPRNSVFGECAVPSPIVDGAVDLLSPVELSAKLRPFSIPSLSSQVKRGDSIDSGYADGDNWVDPLPFPRSPPRSFRSPVTFLSHSRHASRSSPASKDRGVSYTVGVLRPIEDIKEVESDGSGSQELEDTAYAILDAYDASPSEELGEDKACDPFQVDVTVVTEDKAEEEVLSEVPTAIRVPQQHSLEHLHPTREHDLDSYNQPSFASDDNLSSKTALSAQPSYADVSDISKASPIKQDSLLSSISGCSTPNTSILSHHSDANGSPGCSTVGAHAYRPSHLVTASPTTQMGSAGASEESSLLKEVTIDSNVMFTSASVDGLQVLAPERVDSAQASVSGIFHFDRHSSVSGRSVDASPGLSSAQVSRNLPNFAPRKAVIPQERLSGASHFESAGVSHSPLSTHGTSSSVCPGTSSLQEFRPGRDTALGECSPSVSHYNQPSPDDVQEFVPENILHSGKRSSRLSLSAESSCNPSLVKDVLEYPPQDVNGTHSRLPANVVAPREHLAGVSHFDKSPSLARDAPGRPLLGASGARETFLERVFMYKEYPSGALCTSKSGSSAECSHGLSSLTDVIEYAPPDTGSNAGSSVPSPTVRDGYLAQCAAQVGRSLVTENSFGSGEVSECLEFGSGKFTQRLSFPLPPPFQPAEFVEHTTSPSGDDSSVLSKATVVNLGEDVPNACTMQQQEKEQWARPGSDLTAKVRPSQLPSACSPYSGADFTLRRSRAASDLTVKGKSPVITPQRTTFTSKSPSPPLELQGQSDSVQSLYDQYFGDCTPDSGSGFSNPTSKDTAPPHVPNGLEELSQMPDLTPHVFRRGSSPCSDGMPSLSSADSPRPGTILRPLLTGRNSFLCSPFAELIPKANLDSIKDVASLRPSTRLQAKEIGSTIVPLGFRRQRPQPAARTRPMRIASQPLDTVLPASQLREVLRIRTDMAREDLPSGCSSADHASSATRSPLPQQSMSAPPTGGLKQLRLSSVINKRSSILSTHSSSIASSILSLDHLFNSSTPQSPSVSSTTSISRNSLLSSACDQIPEQMHHTLKRPRSNSPVVETINGAYFSQQSSTRHDSRSVSAPTQQSKSWRLSHYRAGSRNDTSVHNTRHFSRRTSTLSLSYAVDEEQEIDEDGPTISHPIQLDHADGWPRPASVLAPPPVHAIATPKPTLLFAIASDDVDQVRQVLENGEAGPNDSVGPQSALAFTLTNDKLAHKPEIVKALLAYGANPSALQNPILNPAPRTQGTNEPSVPPPETTLEGMDPATRYFVARADTAHTRQTSQLIYRSFFRPLTRVRYDVIGQDWALEQLFRVLSMHSQKLAVAPIVVLLCGPSGHGKSLLARKFGSLLDVPTHTVNVTTLRSAHDIWQSFSMSPYEEPSSCTLAEFLTENEGKRCVVVLDEIEKVEDQKALWSLLMPWELGRCSLEAGKRHVDARNVIWLATSNVGHELVSEYHEKRAEPDERMSREDYLELTGMLRPRVSHCLGASLVSRVTTVLPFVPFTLDEKKAIAAEAVYAFAGDASKMLSPQQVESLVMKALPSYHASEGARSLHRAISNILIDTI